MTSNIYSNQWLDQVFEKRNKNYGAYYLRQHADDYTLAGLFFAISFVVLAISSPIIINFFNGNDSLKPIKLESHIFTFAEVTPVLPELVQPLKIKSLASVPKSNNELVKPIIVEENSPIDDKTRQDLSNNNPNNLNASLTGISVNNDTATGSPGGVGNVITDNIDTITYRGGVEIMPQFPGGENAMLNFLVSHLKYPQHLIEDKISGTVYLSFIINKQGEVTGIETLKGVKESRDFENEAKRVIAMMPKWKPGRQNGQNVSVYFTLPVRFSLR